MTLRLTPEDEQALTLLAEAQGVSKQEATVRAIHEAAARRLRRDMDRPRHRGPPTTRYWWRRRIPGGTGQLFADVERA